MNHFLESGSVEGITWSVTCRIDRHGDNGDHLPGRIPLESVLAKTNKKGHPKTYSISNRLRASSSAHVCILQSSQRHGPTSEEVPGHCKIPRVRLITIAYDAKEHCTTEAIYK